MSISLHSFEEGTAQEHEIYLRRCADFAREAASAGVLVSFRLWNKGCDGGQNENTLGLLQKFLPGEWVENTRGYRIQDRVFLEWGDRFGWPDAQGQDLGDRVYCYGLKDHFGILCDGTVVPCCLDSDGVIALGNVFSQPLEEILASDRCEAIREGFRRRQAAEDLCRRCPYARKF